MIRLYVDLSDICSACCINRLMQPKYVSIGMECFFSGVGLIINFVLKAKNEGSLQNKVFCSGERPEILVGRLVQILPFLSKHRHYLSAIQL